MPKGIENWKKIDNDEFVGEHGHTWVNEAWRNKETGELVTIERNPEYTEGETTYLRYLVYVYPDGDKNGLTEEKHLGEVQNHPERVAKKYMRSHIHSKYRGLDK